MSVRYRRDARGHRRRDCSVRTPILKVLEEGPSSAMSVFLELRDLRQFRSYSDHQLLRSVRAALWRLYRLRGEVRVFGQEREESGQLVHVYALANPAGEGVVHG